MTDVTDKLSGADIIPFPTRLPPSIDAAARLYKAVRALGQASAELHDNIPNWRRSINVLTVSLGEIAESLQILSTELTTASLQLQCFCNEELERDDGGCITLSNDG